MILDGLRVLDFGRYIAGPFAACLLGDLGADVIRVEKLDGGEDRAICALNEAGDDGGAQFLHANRNKRGVTLNPTKPAGREVLRRLVETADVVMANVPPQTLVTLGLDYASLSAIKADVILATVDAYGPGPYSDRLGFNGVAEVMSGSVWMSGPSGIPTRCYVPWVDFGSASLLAFGVMAALFERQRTGRGQHVEGALLHTALTFGNYLAIEESVRHVGRVSAHNRGQTSAPVDIFATADGFMIVQVLGQPLWERWVELMDDDDVRAWLTDQRFATDELRGVQRDPICERMARWCANRTTAEVMAILDRAQIPCGPVLSPGQVLGNPHVAASGFHHPVDYPGIGSPAPLASPPVTLSATPGTIRRRAPLLGEHTDEVLGSVGYSAAEIADLRAARVV